ncbi:MAG TPA: hypothetical protein VGC01_07605 [Mucilaginibacter sp.]
MKTYILTISIAFIVMLTACKKSSPDNPNSGNGQNTENSPTTVGNVTNYNGYVVKTIGISRILLAVDDNYNMTVAYLYGGGNKVILKAGTGNTIELKDGIIATCPDAVIQTPDGTIPYLDQDIDNGKLADTTAFSAAVIKIKGFDKSKTGYNQLNLVMCKFLWPADGDPGYHNNVTYLKMKKAAGKKNADYNYDFITKLFSGNISVSDIEIAPPVSASTYITEDHIISSGQASYNPSLNKTYDVSLIDPFFSFSESYLLGTPIVPVVNTLKFEWANASDGTISTDSNGAGYIYWAKFNNIKVGGLDQVVEPADTVNKVFLRITGFDRPSFGFNQLRLFVANDGFYDGSLQVDYNAIPQKTPTLNAIKDIYAAQGLYGSASPRWPHY